MDKLLINIDPALKERLRAVAEAKGAHMSAIVRHAIEDHIRAYPEAEPPYTVPMIIEGRPDVEDLHLFADALSHYASASDENESVTQVSRDGFKVEMSMLTAHHLFMTLVRTKEDFESPVPLGLLRELKVRSLSDHIRVTAGMFRYDPSMGRTFESEVAGGAALILLAVPKKWQDGRECVALVIADPHQMNGECTFPTAQSLVPVLNFTVDFATGTLLRVRDGEHLADKIKPFMGSWMNLLPEDDDDA